MGHDRSQNLEPLRWHRKGEEAREFVDCGIDWLAPVFGNLHGTDPFTKEIFNKCIRHGVSKIKINKVLNCKLCSVRNCMNDLIVKCSSRASIYTRRRWR